MSDRFTWDLTPGGSPRREPEPGLRAQAQTSGEPGPGQRSGEPVAKPTLPVYVPPAVDPQLPPVRRAEPAWVDAAAASPALRPDEVVEATIDDPDAGPEHEPEILPRPEAEREFWAQREPEARREPDFPREPQPRRESGRQVPPASEPGSALPTLLPTGAAHPSASPAKRPLPIAVRVLLVIVAVLAGLTLLAGAFLLGVRVGAEQIGAAPTAGSVLL